jgi:hypothetical protein
MAVMALEYTWSTIVASLAIISGACSACHDWGLSRTIGDAHCLQLNAG